MECFPEDRELLKGKPIHYNHEILEKNTGKEASKWGSKPRPQKRKISQLKPNLMVSRESENTSLSS